MVFLDKTLYSPTGAISLAPWDPSGSEDALVARLRCHPETLRYLRFLPKDVTVDDAKRLREELAAQSNAIQFSIHLQVEGSQEHVFAGQSKIFQIDELNKSCEVGILVSPNMHGRGVATQAIYTMLRYIFEERKLHRAYFVTGSDNVGMRGWLEKTARAKFEGELRDFWVDGEAFSNAVVYGILENEWKETVKEGLEKRMS